MSAKVLFEEKPRWPGAPKICIEKNLPAFETRTDLDTYMNRYAPTGFVIVRLGKCPACKRWHRWAIHEGPSGGSNGDTRGGRRLAEMEEEKP
jgi:hypothetical protein